MTGDESKWLQVRELADRLDRLVTGAKQTTRGKDRSETAVCNADAIVTHIEVCDRHGVGKFLKTIFAGEANLLTVRSASYFGGRDELGEAALCISHEEEFSKEAVFRRVLLAVRNHTVKRILCSPYFADDIRTAIALKELFGVPMCTYLMDDQNIYADGIPDDLIRELFAKSRLRLGISPELCNAYQRKYGQEVFYLPPLVPSRLVSSRLTIPQPCHGEKRGIIIGNIWGQQWLRLLRQTVRNSGVVLTWHSKGEFPIPKDDLQQDSIVLGHPVEDDELVQLLRNTSFAVVPTGLMDEADDRRFIAQLSLPSRIPFMMATSHIPILVVGSPLTAAARFVTDFGIGLSVGYDREAFREAVDQITSPEVNLAMRKRGLIAAGRFAEIGTAEWIWQSLKIGHPVDRRYQDLMPRQLPESLLSLPGIDGVTHPGT